MLSRLETLYLGLLRGFILIVATLALVAAALLIVSSVPELLTRVGVTKTESQSSSLAEFIAEQKPTEGSQDAEEVAPQIPVDSAIKDAAQNFHDYLGTRATASVKDWEQGLQGFKNDFSPEVGNDYALSIKRLSEELKTSKGKPLSVKNVGALIDWHKTRFAANRAAEQAERAAADAAFVFKMEAAFAAFVLFAFITFIFLFVRIERNLRFMRVEVQNGFPEGA